MLRTLSYTTLFIGQSVLLLVLLGLGFLLVLGFFKTREDLDQQEKEIHAIRHASYLLDQQQQQLGKLEKLTWLGGEGESKIEGHLAFVSYLEQGCRANGLTLVSLPEEELKSHQGVTEIKEKFHLEGKLQAQLKMLFQMEIEDQVGCLRRVQLRKQKIRIGREQRELLISEIELNRLTKP